MEVELTTVLKRQRRFFESGKTRELAFRKRALSMLRDAIKDYEPGILEALKKDLNKSSLEAYMSEVGMVLSELEYLLRNLERFARAKRVPTPLAQFPAVSYVQPEPYGLTLIMAPWNYPFMLCMDPLIDAVAAGNCVVLKPSAYAPAVSGILREMLSSIFPDKYICVVEGGRRENEELLNHKFDYIFFTGSAQVGRLVLEKAARHITPVTLELGGKSPCIVDKTADLKAAAKRIAFGKLLNGGQTCVAPDYVLVQEEVKERLVKLLCKEMTRMVGGDSLTNPDYPKIINEKHFKRLLELLKGEEYLVCGADKEKTADPASLKIAPVILADASYRSPAMQEEIFGPILPILTFSSPKELPERVRRFHRPLALYLFSRDKRTIKLVTEGISYGGGCINDTIIHLATPYMGFGGVGGSGMGSYHGKAGFDTFSHKKSIVRKSCLLDLPLRYHPYTKRKERIIRRFLK